MRVSEIYEVVCANCGGTLELPAGPVDRCELIPCPRCSMVLRIEFRPADLVERAA